MKNWIKLEVFYLGKSKKHFIFRMKRWNRDLEKILKKAIYDENYDEVGYIKDIFGPIDLPFISVKANQNQEFEFNPNLNMYAKIS
ncbi:MAG: hypothetical protein ACFFAS_10500 [Promethearchaeota archaeon]